LEVPQKLAVGRITAAGIMPVIAHYCYTWWNVNGFFKTIGYLKAFIMKKKMKEKLFSHRGIVGHR
jgi:hypothetical protein